MGSYKRLIFDGFRRLTRAVVSSESKILSNEIKNPNFVARRPRWYGYRNYVWKLGGLVGFGGMVLVYHRNLETVVYSKRRRFMMVSPHREKVISNYLFKSIKSTEYKGKILGSDHPDSIRVEKMGRKILEGLRKGLCNRLKDDDEERDRLIALLDEYDWEFLVVDEPAMDVATCFLAGKVIFFTGVFKHFQSDVEIALTVAHEVAHVIARHHAEMMCKILWWPLFLFRTPEDESCHFIWHPTLRRLELEAEYIGFIISACAGYDPWEMLKVLTEYTKREILASNSNSNSNSNVEQVSSSTHPDWGTILRKVSEATVMEEALTLYKQALKDKDLHDKEKEPISIFQKLLGKKISNFKYIFTDFNNKFISRCRCRCSASPRSHPFI